MVPTMRPTESRASAASIPTFHRIRRNPRRGVNPLFKLKRPCSSCPFKKGNGENFELFTGRLIEILSAPSFQCHNTIDYSESDVEESYIVSKDCGPQQCAGLMSLLNREEIPSSIMQVGVRLRALNLEELDPDKEAYETIREAVEAHGGDVQIVLGQLARIGLYAQS